jgi:predicted DNA-binding WGR domain protein
MIEELEFAHDSKNSKIYIIEKVDKKITIKFGKKGSILQEKELIFKTDNEASNEFDKKIKEKLNKGYNKLNNKSNKISTKNIKSKINIETVNFFIIFLTKIAKKVGEEMYKLEKKTIYNDNSKLTEDEQQQLYQNKISKFFNSKVDSINKQIVNIQDMNILPFLKSGIIVKKISNKLKENLLNDINNFSNKNKPDYHPGSNNKVLDIVHPSLYPLITEVNKRVEDIDFWNRPYEDSKYQWLPSEFKIDKDGKCKIESYINNLPISEKSLYENIEKLFEFVLPQFEDIWSYSNIFDFYNGEWTLSRKISNTKVFKKLELKDMNLQVIIKIVKISLKNKEDLIGAWHVEGMSHENIVASATCTLEQTKNFNSKLYFKRFYSENEVESIISEMPQNPPKEFSKFLHDTLVPLGKVKISDGSIVMFPNSHIHKIDMESSNKSEETRTIIVFWLINPNNRITSTKDIPQQKYPIAQAHKNRLELMKERTFYKQTFNQRDLNLCEH